jgi:uncharacterized cupin superfamily protein
MRTATGPKGLHIGPETILHLATDQSIRSLNVAPGYWDHRDRRPELGEGRILSVFTYTATWTWWERHPVGDEIAYLLAGDVELCLDDRETQRTVKIEIGEAVIIPEGIWHTLHVGSPSRLLFVTPQPAATEVRQARAGDG